MTAETPESLGYAVEEEQKDLLSAMCLDFDVMSLVCGDLPPTRGIKELMRRSDQGPVNSCVGFGATHAAMVSLFNQTGVWRFLHPMWSYRRAQEQSNIRGDRGATIHGLARSAKVDGFLPEDFDGDGQPESVYTTNYNMRFPEEAASVAKQWLLGYSIELTSFDACLRFLQAGQGAIITGGPWGNWKPNAAGVCTKYRSGGGGHSRAYVDWITINGDLHLVEANSHGSRWGDDGFSYHTKGFVDSQCRDNSFVAIGLSDLQHPMVRKVLTYDDLRTLMFSRGRRTL